MSQSAQFFATWILPLICLYIGIRMERYRWQRNANEIQRIESNGKLFKVIHDKDYQP